MSAIQKRIQRLLGMLSLFQSGAVHNTREIADACGVSRRTVFRDLQILQESGVPLRYDETRHTYSLQPQSLALPTEFSWEESLSLLVLCHSLGDQKGGVPFQEASHSAASKLANSLSPKLLEQLGPLAPTVEIRLEPCNPLREAKPTYRQLLAALTKRKSVRIRYRTLSTSKHEQTKLHPYRLLFSRRSWYVIGRSSLHRGVRTFNLSRIEGLEQLDDSYKIPQRFSVDNLLGNAWHLIRERPYNVAVHVRFSKLVAGNVAEVQWHKTQRAEFRSDGTLDFHVTVDGLSEISWWIMGYADQAEVVSPPELRQLIHTRAQSLCRVYAEPET